MALAKVDLPDVISGNSSFAGNRAHEVADFHSVACSDGHEEARHSACRSARPVAAFRRSRLRGRSSVFRRRATLSALALEKVERSRSQL
jgi:hypothetical protein